MDLQRNGDWIQTFSGLQFWPLDPRPDEINIEDIAHALSLQCRFGGHCNRFYSVADHSIHVSMLVENSEHHSSRFMVFSTMRRKPTSLIYQDPLSEVCLITGMRKRE